MAETETTSASTSDPVSSVRYQFAVERIEDCWFEALPLIYSNQRETGTFPTERFNPPRDLYVNADRAGKLALYTMRDAGKLVGYQVFALELHPRYRATGLGIQDVAFVDPEHRGPVVLDFFKFADMDLEHRGLKPMRHSAERKDISSLLTHLGYHRVETTWIKD